MGTRIYCDSCGSTCHNPAKYEVRKCGLQDLDLTNQAHIQNMKNMGLTSALNIPMQPYKPLIIVDLCPACEKTWPERVKNLTQASGE